VERSAGSEQPEAWHSGFLAYETPQVEHPSKSARTKSGIVRNWEKLLRRILSEQPTVQFGNTRRPAQFTWTIADPERDGRAWILQVVIASRASRRYAIAPAGQKERADRLLLRLVGNSRESGRDSWEGTASGSVPVVGLAISESDLFPLHNQPSVGWAGRK
jgi:hypothetical protein